MAVPLLFAALMLGLGPLALAKDLPEAWSEEPMAVMDPSTSCSLEIHSRTLACVCQSVDMSSASLQLQLGYFINNLKEDISKVHVRQCSNIHVRLDFTGVDLSVIHVEFSSILNLTIDDLIFDTQFRDRQELALTFYNVEQLTLTNLFLMNTVQINAKNVKKAKFVGCTFAHIPEKGFNVSMAHLLEIQKSLFLRVFPGSVLVEKTKEVNVAFNEMSINAFDVVTAKDGSTLVISCNRILNRPVSPECIQTTPTTSTTSTTTMTTPVKTSPILPAGLELEGGAVRAAGSGGQGREGASGELIGGIVAGIILLLILNGLLLFLKFRRKDRSKGDADGKAAQYVCENGQIPDSDADRPIIKSEKDNLLISEDSEEVKEVKPKFISPIWLDEIQQNRIFTKQKCLLSDDELPPPEEGLILPPEEGLILPPEEGLILPPEEGLILPPEEVAESDGPETPPTEFSALPQTDDLLDDAPTPLKSEPEVEAGCELQPSEPRPDAAPLEAATTYENKLIEDNKIDV